jgi:hypothetical protein
MAHPEYAHRARLGGGELMGDMNAVIPQARFSPEEMPWARSIESAVSALQMSAFRSDQSHTNSNNAQAATLSSLAAQIVAVQGLEAGLQTQINNLIGATINTVTLNATGAVNTGSVTASGNVSVTGNVTTGSGSMSAANVTGVNVFAQSLSTNITAGRVALWGRTSDGYIATASSSERLKTNITPVDPDAIPDAMLGVVVSYFQYKAEVSMRDDPTDPNYVGPDYHVGTNIGAIAERLHELGLWQFVVYERDEDDSLLLVDGEPVPSGIHDILIGWGVLMLAQRQERENTARDARMDKLAARLSVLDGQTEN